MIVDTSVILSLLFDEKHAEWSERQLQEHATELRMSTVNLAEVLIRLHDRRRSMSEELEEMLSGRGIRFIPPDEKQARIAAEARFRYPLNLGDCFVYALASVEKCPILTLDKDFRRIDLPVVMPG
ncbi:MAG: hypothetical protein A2Z34_08990 [Planctomycetes bacterium RBG_16_59_8]|nr:MAG: hypothetical protein A2Z34_08990 [Planctomycetes bacterium RBG_16_59_8]